MSSIVEFLFLYRAAIYDIASIFGILGFLFALASIRFGSRFISTTCGWMFAIATVFCTCNLAAECHYEYVQAQLKVNAAPYFLAGYYAAK